MTPSWLLVLFSLISIFTLGTASPHAVEAADSPRLETSFQVTGLTTDPFDYEKTDVRVQLRGKSDTVSIPAFFDGGTTWRARHTPTSAGTYTVAGVTLNGKAVKTEPQPRQWSVSNTAVAGFVRIDPRDSKRFVRGAQTRFFPIGHNQAWQSNGLPDVPTLFGKMGAAGENWSRVWMNHWDNKNLDWPNPTPGKYGTLDLTVAKKWDAIVDAAEKNGIAFQMVFQHHGQYSTQVNPNWNDNPYSVKNGGFLNSPEEFFTNPQAKALTKRKLRYALARWGYSPAIMAWELFNEVQFTDAGRSGKWSDVAAWHREMAAFLRQQDLYHHLITTSSTDGVPAQVWETMDYYQEHAYPADLMTAMNSGNTHTDRPTTKPYFVGEYGPSGVNDSTGHAVHAGLWAGLMSSEAGAPQFWTWDDVEKHNLYGHFKAASHFVAVSGLPEQNGLKKFVPSITTPVLGDLSFGPGGGWTAVKQNEFTVESGGPPAGIGALSRFLQGNANRSLSPKPWVFKVNYPKAGQFIVDIAQISKAGAHVKLSVNGQTVERDFPAAGADSRPEGEARVMRIDVPAGPQTITLDNSGGDWAEIARLTLTDYAPALGSYGLSNQDYVVAWVYQRANVMATDEKLAPAASGQLALPSLAPGRYTATWWDTHTGEPLTSSQMVVVAQKPATLTTPTIVRDVALVVRRENASRSTR